MKELPIRGGKFVKVDDDKFMELSIYSWVGHVDPKTNNVYAVRFFWDGSRSHAISVHRQVLGLKPGDKRKVDFKNRDSLDCQRENLRIGTQSQTQFNRGKRKDNKAGIKGVWLHKPGIYRAALKVNGVRKNLGSFSTADDAGKAYDDAAKVAHGEFYYSSEL